VNLDGPIAYFISFRTYGTWLHGDEKGSVDRTRNQFGAPLIPPNAEFEERRKKLMLQDEMVFSDDQREATGETVREVCNYRGWRIHAINVRTNHVHVVVEGGATPEKMLGDFKRYGTRRMRERGLIPADRMVWSEHGSTKYLWNDVDLYVEACNYVKNCQ
jgi:REP element-mobilizing transposase RayT